VTELEILHGVLNQPSAATDALFYFRGPEQGETESPCQRVAALKERIRAQHRNGLLSRAPRENYAGAEALGAWVKQDLWELIQQAFPPESELDPVAREAAEHELFGRSRARVYVSRPAMFDALDAHAAGQGPPLVVLGESGVGKSALLANWVRRQRALGAFVVEHYVGSSLASADCSALLRRVVRSLDQHFELRIDMPEAWDALRVAFANALHRAAAKGRVILVLDGLNQLEERDEAAELAWLPLAMPGNVRLICSALPGRAWEVLRERNVDTLTVEPLSREERLELIPRYLKSYGKELSQERIVCLAGASQSGNPLYLRTLLEELRQWGDNSSLDTRIAHYLAAADPRELFDRVLGRWEQDFEREQPHLVRESMRRLWAARRGLSEAELLDMLGHEAAQGLQLADASPLPQGYWSPLRLAADAALVSRSGILSFAHDYLRQAVEARYVQGPDERRAAHLDVANHFSLRELGPRQLEELPWQLARAESWTRLSTLLVEPRFFTAAWQADEFEVKSYWRQLERNTQLKMVDAYADAIGGTSNSQFAWHVGFLLSDTGHVEAALTIRQRLVAEYRGTGYSGDLQQGLGNLANLLYVSGQLDEALLLYQEQEGLCRQSDYAQGLQSSLGNQANILAVRGEHEQANAKYDEQARICLETGNLAGLQASLGNRANILKTQGQLAEALALNEERARLCKASGNLDSLQITLGNQANILLDLERLDEANRLYEEQQRICDEIGNLDGLETSLGNQGTLLYELAELEAAMAQFQEQENICRKIGNQHDLSSAIGNQGLVLQARGQLLAAQAQYAEQERLCRQLGDCEGLQRSLGNLASVLHVLGDFAAARALYQEQARICTETDNPAGLAHSWANQAALLRDEGQLDLALPLAQDAVRLAKDHGYVTLGALFQDILDSITSEAVRP